VAETTKNGTATGGRGMGRGLAAILSSSSREETGLREIPTGLVSPNPNQPRRDFDDEALLALAESVKARGILQPVVVRPLADGRYELIAGERRLRAAVVAGLGQVPAVVRETDETERLELALIENMARQDLNAIEEARACATLVDDLGTSKEEVARRVGRSRVAVSNLIRMLDLPDEAIAMIGRGDLSEGHGRALLLAPDHADRRDLARAAAAGGWSVRETEAKARAAGEKAGKPRTRRPRPRGIHPDQAAAAAQAADALGAALGADVRVSANGTRFRATIDLGSLDDALDLAGRIARRRAA
jgi:ParB family transcriptional regulator, chromosome partitioning protein